MSQTARQVETEPVLRGLFDHAGMFPPAEKPLNAALADAAAFAKMLKRPGMVGADLVLAWTNWANLTSAALGKAGFRGPCNVALVGLSVDEIGAVLKAVRAARTPAARIRVVSVEAHVEPPFQWSPWPTAPDDCPVFIEPRGRVEWGSFCQRLKADKLGLKVRCAGPTALDRPALAAAIEAVAVAGIPFKATQGLHHPVPRPGIAHGFLGLLAALRLRQTLGREFAPEIIDCLGELDTVAFDLSDGIAWRGEQVPAAVLARLPPFSIGSCSLSEPDEQLSHAYGVP